MQTQKPALNLLSSLTNNAPAARQGSNTLPDVSFNSVLSREVARQPERPASITPGPQAAPKPAENAEKNTNSGPLPPQNQAPAPTQANSGDKAQSSTQGNAQGGSAPAKAGDKASGKDAARDDTNAAQSDAAAAATAVDPASALLALVASFNTPAASAKAQPAAETETAAVASATTAGIKVDKSNDPISLAPATAAGKDEKPADAFARLLPADAKAAPDAKLATATDAAPKLAAAKSDHAAQLTRAEPQAEAAPQLAANSGDAALNPLAARAVKVEAAAASTLKETAANPAITAVAQASAAANTPALAKLQAQVAPRVGNPGWDQALGQHVVYMASNGTQTASLTLNPPDLGPLQVVLHISNDQANASFTAAQPEVRAALEAAMPKLREMMSDAGISLGNAMVGTGLPNQQQSTPGEQSRQQSSAQFGPEVKDDLPRTVITRPISQALGVVDTFV